jgi:photosystem II stability/assembly factor-like uncharacterized protein
VASQIACPTTGVCFAVGENDSEAFVYRSMDGGETWSNVLPSQYASGLSLMAVEALSETEVYVGGGVFGSFGVTGSVLYSSDSGTTWTLESIPNNYINALSFPTSENGAATSINTDQQSGILIYTA